MGTAHLPPLLPEPVSDATFMDVTPERNAGQERYRGGKRGLGHRIKNDHWTDGKTEFQRELIISLWSETQASPPLPFRECLESLRESLTCFPACPGAGPACGQRVGDHLGRALFLSSLVRCISS